MIMCAAAGYASCNCNCNSYSSVYCAVEMIETSIGPIMRRSYVMNWNRFVSALTWRLTG